MMHTAPANELGLAPVRHYLAQDHVRLDALMGAALANETIDRLAYAHFRSGLLRHIAMEEKILLPTAKLLRHGEPIAVARQLRLDHSALSAMVVPTPTRALLEQMRALLMAHNVLEEAVDGLYEACEPLLVDGQVEMLSRLQAVPEIHGAPHFDGPSAFAAIDKRLRAAGRA